MIALLDSFGPMIWRATWQATLLAVLVAVILWCCGERLAPRWRFLMWGVVLMRLLLVATPGSSWSLFNLANLSSNSDTELVVQSEKGIDKTQRLTRTTEANAKAMDSEPPLAASDFALMKEVQSAELNAISPLATDNESRLSQAEGRWWADTVLLTRVFTSLWLVGVLLLSQKLIASAILLRRRLSGCQAVTDPTILKSLDSICRKMKIASTPALLVTPENVSPYIVGTWRPKIVLPESVVTESLPIRLQHVFAHELSHLSRWDLWSNWLLLAARILHWFNPVSWFVVREMQAEREAACDEMAFSALSDTGLGDAGLSDQDRSSYADSIIELAANLKPPGIAPGLIGFFSAKARLQQRIERFLRASSSKSFWTPVSVAMLLVVALSTLTDAQSGSPPLAAAPPTESKEKIPADTKNVSKDNNATNTGIVKGRCIEAADRKPLAGITVRLYKSEGRTAQPVEIARTISDKDGKYEFKGLVPARPEDNFNQLIYSVLGFADDRPIGHAFGHRSGDEEVAEIWMMHKGGTLSGKVVDTKGRPIKGAIVSPYSLTYGLAPGTPFATTDAEGSFKIENVGITELSKGRAFPIWVSVLHPDYPRGSATVATLKKDITVILQDACVITGTVVDQVTGKPAENAEVTAWYTHTATDVAGRFRVVVPEGNYKFAVKAKDRVCADHVERECLPGQNIELPPFELVSGGFITGQVVNTKTGESVSVNDRGQPISIGLYGPAQPPVKNVISPVRMATVDSTGRFTVRAFPGENFPYFYNMQGDRMAWDTTKQPAVVVKEGETTTYNMLITPKVTPEEKLSAAKKAIEALSKNPTDRTAQILLEFRKLNHTVDETELWCSLMRELVAIGPDAVPQLCAELDEVKEDRAMRRLAFALRAIGDPRAVPALIRAIPKTLLPSSSDFGLPAGSKELDAFMMKHDLDKDNQDKKYFSLGRPVREIFGTLHSLTKQNFDDGELFSIHLSEDARRKVLQQRMFNQQAVRWEKWWNANWQTLTKDAVFSKVGLNVKDEVLPDAPATVVAKSSISGGVGGAVLSPASEKGKHNQFFYDLDTGYQPRWPKEFSKDETKLDQKQLNDWAAKNGVDLMCVTHKSPDGKVTYQLRAIGVKVVEIDTRSARNIDQLVANGTLPEGRPVTELLMHFDAKTEKLEPNAYGTFIFTTREGNRGVITTTDRITRTQDLTGTPSGMEPSGVGFHRGVKFNLREIVPPKVER